MIGHFYQTLSNGNIITLKVDYFFKTSSYSSILTRLDQF